VRRFVRYSSPYFVFAFLWQFNDSRIPAATTNAFIKATGGGAQAILDSQHLTGILGGPNVILLLLGVLIYSIGTLSGDTREDTLQILQRRVSDLSVSLERNPQRPAKTKRGRVAEREESLV